MKSAEKRIEGKIEEMKATEARVSVSGQQKNEQDAALQGSRDDVRIHEAEDAAKVFDRLELSVLFEIASQIAPRKMSDIMGQMQPEAAERLTVEMARRSTGDRSSSAGESAKDRRQAADTVAQLKQVINNSLTGEF
jgi:flagellar motility protein MotE (MotC chaperone)